MKALPFLAAIEAASLAFSGLLAFNRNPDPTSELQTGKLNIIADRQYANPGDTVSYSVSFAENSGYTAAMVRLVHDERLSVELTASGKPELTKGEASDSLNVATAYSEEAHSIGFSTMGTENETDSGKLYTIKLHVPKDAKAGDVYEIKLECKNLVNLAEQPLAYHVIDGWIMIPTGETTTTTTATTTTTTVTTTTVTTTTTAPQVLRGDTDLDKEITSVDAQLTLVAYTERLASHPTGLSELQTLAADVDYDKEITSSDAQFILVYYVNNMVSHKPTDWSDLIK